MTNGLTLQQQLLARVTQFLKNFPNITQSEIARYCGIGESNFGARLWLVVKGYRRIAVFNCTLS
jgi:hypothetical protein